MSEQNDQIKDFREWKLFLNEVVGVLLLGGAFTALAAKDPTKCAIAFIVIAAIFMLLKSWQYNSGIFAFSRKWKMLPVEKKNLGYLFDWLLQRTKGIPFHIYWIGWIAIITVLTADRYHKVELLKELVGL
ncbi:hypothetical protein KI809_11455 [Geobacter pelophilus]|uniref:Uncharacterized protein n=1 Tax=Geoanaerobacter pelophilus TaxID=60036 RepID=A0AAW4L5U3_9BACT|nr:hypothetical protein [Geoanaerobacter pelophilus]MBT0664917.1 hypothetical protein [Geoanaerobacter pelophilus]